MVLDLDARHAPAAALRARLALADGNLPLADRLVEEQILLNPDAAVLYEVRSAVATLPADGAVEELLRFLTPLNQMFRTAAVDAEIGDQEVAAGDRVCLLYPSANRDAAFFDRPDEIDFHRDPNPHVAFGLGTHFCLGANLARLTLRVFFEELAARIERVEALAPPAYEPNVFIKGVRRFDVRLHFRGDA